MSEAEKPNVGKDMLRIHRVITRGLEVSAERGAEYAREGFPSAAIQEGFITYVRALSGVLDAHHLGEDEAAFPGFREKMPDAPYDKLMADHQEIVGILAELDQRASEARSSGSAESVQALNDVIAALSLRWHPHIAIEQRLWDPETVAALMSEAENLQLSQKIAETSQKHLKTLPVEVPFILYNLGSEDRAVLIKAMPPLVTQQLVPLVWRAQWEPMKPFLLE